MADWQKIKTEYITTDTSYRKLAAKHGVPMSTLRDQGKNDGWVQARAQYRTDTVTKLVQKDTQLRVDRYKRIQDDTDRLLAKLEKAIDELDVHLVSKKRKIKTVEYKNAERPDKATKEITEEREEVEEYTSIIDRKGLQLVAAALKDIKDIQMIKSDADMREQNARIARLEREAKEDAPEQSVIMLSDELNKYAD